MPVQIDARGLRSALEELAKKIQVQDRRLTCQVQCINDFLVANNTAATQLYRIAQEAMNNAISHGHATAVDFVLKQDERHTVMEIQDDGIGFDPKKLFDNKTSSRGMGLKIMRHRMSTIGGYIIAERRKPRGMTIRCILPKKLAR
jgi:signal transduction histidine kinase